ncbi:hypothetical protein P7C70_g3346, partial [Phenoliferia sp. Uapishka_3]
MSTNSVMSGLHLQPGERTLIGIRNAIEALVYSKPTHSFVVQIWCLWGAHFIILFFSLIGITARYRRGNGWVFIKDESGFIRPNPAITTQGLYAIYAVFFCIAAPIYPLKNIPTNAAFAWELITFIPLGIAFHAITWSTALAPTTTLAFLSPSSIPSRSLLPGRVFSAVAILSLIAFLASLTPTLYHTAHYRSLVYAGVNSALTNINTALATPGNTADTRALLALASDSIPLQNNSRAFLGAVRRLTMIYFSWAVVWIAIYIPTALRLLFTLQQRRSRLQRSLKSLKVLEELVTNDGIEAAAVAAHQLPVLDRVVIRSRSEPSGYRVPAPQYVPTSHSTGYHTIIASFDADHRELSSGDLSRGLAAFDSASPLIPSSPPPEAVELLALESELLSSSVSSSYASSTACSSFTSPSTTSLSNPTPRKVKGNGRPTTSGSQKIAAAKHFAEKLMDDFGIGGIGQRRETEKELESDRTKVRGEEVNVALGKTSKLLATIGLQFVMTVIMTTSYFIFCVRIIRGTITPAEIRTTFVIWTGWTFVGPAFLGSLLFAILSIRDTPATAQVLLTPADLEYAPSPTPAPTPASMPTPSAPS